MKVRSLFCPCNGRSDNPLDHYNGGDWGCPGRPDGFPLGRARSILKGCAEDKDHADGKITATRLLGCPREQMILDFLPVDGLDVANMSNLHEGTLAHRDAAANAPMHHYTEMEVHANVCGIDITGHVDMAGHTLEWIDDLKTHGEMAYKMKRKTPGMDPDVRAQLSIYAIAIEKMTGTKVHELRSSHLSMASWGTPVSFKRVATPMSEEQLAAYRPKGGSSTVAELVLDYATFQMRQKENWPLESSLGLMPLRGLDMIKGKKCERYCLAKGLCDKLVRDHG